MAFSPMAFRTCFKESLKLGLTSFGGPVAHLAYFREAYVERLQWLSDEKFAELLALCQFIPGPASSQLGAAIGYEKGGWLGGVGAWLGFTLPSAILMILFVTTLNILNDWALSGAIQGLTFVAVAVVANAVIGMQRKLCPNAKGIFIALLVAAILFAFQSPSIQPLLILIGGILGAGLFRKDVQTDILKSEQTLNHPIGALAILGVFILGVLILSSVQPNSDEMTTIFGLTKTGSMVFGGGHVVLPLLEAETVAKGVMSRDEFLAGYGFAQAMPGPMFSFGAYVGALVGLGGNPWVGGPLGVVLIFLPGMILLSIGMPIWNAYKQVNIIRASLRGASAAVVGLILAALIHMLRSGVINTLIEACMVVGLAVIVYKKIVPVWAVVLSGVGIGFLV